MKKILQIFNWIWKFIKLFVQKCFEKDKQKHFLFSMGILYYLGTMNFILGREIKGWVLWALAVGFFKEFFWDWFFGTILKLNKISKVFGEADWWDFLFDWLGILFGLIFIFFGKYIF